MANSTTFKEGNTARGAGSGRVKGTKTSRLRGTLNKLKLLEPSAIDVIETSLKGKAVDKARVDTAKWIITSIASLTRTAITEETNKMSMEKDRLDMLEQERVKKEGTNNVPPPVRFQTHIVRVDDDDDMEDE